MIIYFHLKATFSHLLVTTNIILPFHSTCTALCTLLQTIICTKTFLHRLYMSFTSMGSTLVNILFTKMDVYFLKNHSFCAYEGMSVYGCGFDQTITGLINLLLRLVFWKENSSNFKESRICFPTFIYSKFSLWFLFHVFLSRSISD